MSPEIYNESTNDIITNNNKIIIKKQTLNTNAESTEKDNKNQIQINNKENMNINNNAKHKQKRNLKNKKHEKRRVYHQTMLQSPTTSSDEQVLFEGETMGAPPHTTEVTNIESNNVDTKNIKSKDIAKKDKTVKRSQRLKNKRQRKQEIE